MQAMTGNPQTTKYEPKRLKASHFLGSAVLFGFLWIVVRQIPGEESGGIAFVSALTALFCRPEGRREWQLTVIVALGVTVAQLAGHLIGYAFTGMWPPRVPPIGSDQGQLVIALGTTLGALVAAPSIQGLGRKPIFPVGEVERTSVDLSPRAAGILFGLSIATLSALLFVERWTSGESIFAPPGFSFLVVAIILSTGSVVMIAWQQAGIRKPLLLARLGVSLLIGSAGYLLSVAVHDHFSDPTLGTVPALLLIAVYIAAPTLAWWQLRRFVRRHRMLLLHATGNTRVAARAGSSGASSSG